jgi:hypothetical protein
MKGLFCIPFLCLLHYVSGQDTLLKAQIIEKGSSRGVSFAAIGITETHRGTAADESGKFQLVIKTEDRSRRLLISCLGYVSPRPLSIDSLLRQEKPVIALESDIRVLQDVEIVQSRINPLEVVKTALDSLSKNYNQKPFNLDFYTVLSTSNELTGKMIKVETLLEGYFEGYASHSRKKFQVSHKLTTGENPLSDGYPYWPSLEIHRGDLISNPERIGIFQEKSLSKFTLEYKGITLMDTDTLFEIHYSLAKPTRKITGYETERTFYKGRIFITTTSHAILRHDLETDQFVHSIIYRRIGQHYYPYFISGTRTLGPSEYFAMVKNELTLLNVKTTDVKIIGPLTNEFQDLLTIPDDPEFWKIHFLRE